MSWRTNRSVILLRNFGRALGLNRRLGSLFSWRGYEARFQERMFAAIRSGDVVWDVGANVGLYSKKFSDIAGPNGKVFAYEPSRANLQRLNETVASLVNVTVVPVALGDREGVAIFEQGADPLGATSRIVDKAERKSETQVEIQVSSGDHLVSSGTVLAPNVIKIDTEGFELEVLRGLRQSIRMAGVRAVFVEMHFGILQERGMPNAPLEIENLLVSSGFSLSWPDASHLIAARVA